MLTNSSKSDVLNLIKGRRNTKQFSGEDISVEEIEFDDVHRLIAEGEIEDQMSIAALLSAKHVYAEHIKISKKCLEK